MSAWFAPDPVLWSTHPTLLSVASCFWFYEDGYKITLETSVHDAMRSERERLMLMCGESAETELTCCALPAGHECKHFAVSWRLLRDAPALPVSSVRIERVRETS